MLLQTGILLAVQLQSTHVALRLAGERGGECMMLSCSSAMLARDSALFSIAPAPGGPQNNASFEESE